MASCLEWGEFLAPKVCETVLLSALSPPEAAEVLRACLASVLASVEPDERAELLARGFDSSEMVLDDRFRGEFPLS